MPIEEFSIHTETEMLLQDKIRIEAFSSIINTRMEGCSKVSKHTTISNSCIGKYFAIGLYSFMQRVKSGRYVTIGSRVSIGAFSHPTNWLSTLEFQFRDSTYFYGDTLSKSSQKSIQPYIIETTIGSDVWIADNVFIRTGVEVGTGAIIGAGSVVVKDVQPYSIVAGNPAKHIRYRFNQNTIHKLLASKWWQLDIADLEGLEFDNVEKALTQIHELGLSHNV